ncbi:MAG: hypothetical protein K0Q93_3184 [Nocardioidaceae bacterium]|jgi:hypothetical protein|nr:hypothetical protein [Nocardioidaceae bacterium]
MARSLPSFDSTDVATGRLVVTVTPVKGVYMPSSPTAPGAPASPATPPRSTCRPASTAASVSGRSPVRRAPPHVVQLDRAGELNG